MVNLRAPAKIRRFVQHLQSHAVWQPALVWASIMVVALRGVLGTVMALTWTITKRFLPLSLFDTFAIFGDLPAYTQFPADILLGVWLRWDAVAHLKLAMAGYANSTEGYSVFYPLYATLVRYLSYLTAGDLLVAGLLISTFATLASLALLYVMAQRYFNHEAAKWSVLALALFPTSIFLLAPFTESLFLALTLGMFTAALHRRWIAAGLLGFLASLTRAPGIFNALPLAIIAWDQWRGAGQGQQPSPLRLLAGISLAAISGLGFLLWRQVAGYPPIPEVLKEHSGIVMVNPIRGLVSAILQWVRVMDLQTCLDLGSALTVILISILMLVRPKWRIPELLAYLLMNTMIFLTKESFVASSLQSMSRYILVAFPIYIVIGEWLSRQTKPIRFIYATLSGGTLICLSMLYSIFVFIG
jgi:hypothetical protein